MKILLAIVDIFTVTGGGQSFYADLIRNTPGVDFTYFTTKPVRSHDLAPNVTTLPLGNTYREAGADLDLTFASRLDGFTLDGAGSDLLLLLDLASAASGMSFDILEMPDFQPYAALLPDFMRAMGVGFDRAVLSMHGTLTHALADNWAPDALFALDKLRVFEIALYRSVDLRYGIGRPYLEEWRQRGGIASHHFDIRNVVNFENFRQRRDRLGVAWSDGARPDLVYVGRHDRCKGPDLFVDYAGTLPRDSFNEARIVGPSVEIAGFGSLPALTRMSERRALETRFETLSRADLFDRYASSPWFVLLPSRRDTFNLACLEALLSGCPVAISSTTGASDFIGTVLPELPCIHLDPDRLHESDEAVLNALRSYGRVRAELGRALESVDPRPVGPSLEQIWRAAPEADEDLRRSLADMTDEVLEQVALGITGRLAGRLQAQHGTRIDEILGLAGDGLLGLANVEQDEDKRTSKASAASKEVRTGEIAEFGNFLKQLPSQVSKVADARRSLAVRTGGLLAVNDTELTALAGALAPLVFSANRVSLFDMMAETEARRGNDLLYATYKVRSMRLTGGGSRETVDRVAGVLTAEGFPREADVVRWLHGPDKDLASARRYLDSTRTAFRTPPSRDIESVVDRRTGHAPQASIIVSLYRAADKLPAFLRGLSRLTERTRRSCEVVLVDSHSPDDTQAVIARELDDLARAGRPLSVVCIRTGLRETIQAAWNRGIVAARADYVSFLGVDEMNRTDAFDIMIDFLDAHPDVDWVQGTAVVTDVAPNGSFLRDTMAYDRRFENDVVQLLDTCFIGYVGAMYRKSIHDRVGFYDSSFRGAGDTEFKNRALPSMRVVTLPTCLGFFLNYPEERVTASAAVEIEDIRAWYLHRSAAGMGYHFENDPDDAVDLFRRCLAYRKTYLDQTSTDLELALAIHAYLRSVRSDRVAAIEEAASHVNRALGAYRMLDTLEARKGPAVGLAGDARVRILVEDAALQLEATATLLRVEGWTGDLTFLNDNRSHQHFNLWPSTLGNPTSTSRPHVPLLAELAPDGNAEMGLHLLVSPALTFKILVDAAEIERRNLVCRVDGKTLLRSTAEDGPAAFTRPGDISTRGSWAPRIEFVDGSGIPVKDIAAALAIDLLGVTDPFSGDNPLSVQNLHEVEMNDQGLPSHRWTGPGRQARISIPIVCQTDGNLDIVIVHPGQNSFEDITVTVGGQTMPVTSDQEGWREPGRMSVRLPRQATPSALEIGLSVARVSTSNGDTRELGVAWAKATLTFGYLQNGMLPA